MALASLDWVLLAVIGASLLLGAWRGFIYEALSLASWIAAFVLAQAWAERAGAMLPMTTASVEVRQAAGLVVVFIAVLFAGTVLAWLLKKLASGVGLGPADRLLGAGFGAVRGVLVLLAATLVVQATPLKLQEWWAESVGAGMLVVALRGLRNWLPAGWMAPWAA